MKQREKVQWLSELKVYSVGTIENRAGYRFKCVETNVIATPLKGNSVGFFFNLSLTVIWAISVLS